MKNDENLVDKAKESAGPVYWTCLAVGLNWVFVDKHKNESKPGNVVRVKASDGFW